MVFSSFRSESRRPDGHNQILFLYYPITPAVGRYPAPAIQTARFNRIVRIDPVVTRTRRCGRIIDDPRFCRRVTGSRCRCSGDPSGSVDAATTIQTAPVEVHQPLPPKPAAALATPVPDGLFVFEIIFEPAAIDTCVGAARLIHINIDFGRTRGFHLDLCHVIDNRRHKR